MDMPEWSLDRQMITMLRVDWPWLFFSPSARLSEAGWHIAFRRYCCSKWWKGRTPRACSNHVFAIQCDQPRANHSRSGCDHACIGDSTVEREGGRERASDNQGRRVSRGLPVQNVRTRCGEEASAALATRFHLMMPSQLSSSPARPPLGSMGAERHRPRV